MAVTITQIARQANLSISTVSKALHRYEDVSPETLEKVSRIAIELGYMPKFSGFDLRASASPQTAAINTKTGKINLILFRQTPAIRRDLYFQTLMEHLHAHAAGKGLLLLESYPQTEDDFDKVLAAPSDGCILLSNIQAIEPPLLYKMKAMAGRLPIVFLSNYNREYERLFHSVRADNFEAGYQATRHALAKGCETVHFIYRFPALALAGDRLAGYEKAMQEAGRQAGILRFEESHDKAGTLPVPDTFFSGLSGLAGFVGDGEYSAVRLGRLTREKGLFNPATMLFVGIDGTTPFTADDVRRASFQLDLESMAGLAYHVIDRAHQNPDLTVQRLLVGGRIIENTMQVS